MSSPYAEPAASEDRAPEEIFSKVNAYTEAVSMIVQKQVEAWLRSKNLAARLQSLNRDLDARLVIDAYTKRVATSATVDFERREAMRIRGRSSPEDVYLLPLEESGAGRRASVRE